MQQNLFCLVTWWCGWCVCVCVVCGAFNEQQHSMYKWLINVNWGGIAKFSFIKNESGAQFFPSAWHRALTTHKSLCTACLLNHRCCDLIIYCAIVYKHKVRWRDFTILIGGTKTAHFLWWFFCVVVAAGAAFVFLPFLYLYVNVEHPLALKLIQ